jgi:hypothetical protein
MDVNITISEGEDLTIGIKTSNKRNNGQRSTTDNAGWFKVDYFRIHKISDEGQVDSIDSTIDNKEHTTNKNAIFDLQGRKIANNFSQRGLYIIDGRKYVK